MEAAYTAVADSTTTSKPERKDKPTAPIKTEKKGKRKAVSFDEPPNKIPNIKVELDTVAQEENWSSKIENERFIYIARSSVGVKIFMGEHLANPRVSTPSSKTIELNVEQFLTFYGLFLSGKAECAERKNNTKEPGSLSPLFDLSGDVYFTWSRFQSSDLAIVRTFTKRGKSKDMYPTKNGISLGEKVFNSIMDFFRTMASGEHYHPFGCVFTF
ncbi:hypothetical protein RvY_12327 [Ramazzottius varieornatus]|uniref:Uncharacterized protein n=1 Tax=Ramazzottius varieornatus TaxID=947166 RepID=A0A1D1VSW0_RAMVA|nr:hypothetical protein RvY_12327 [Ramazzottius varieornatus]